MTHATSWYSTPPHPQADVIVLWHSSVNLAFIETQVPPGPDWSSSSEHWLMLLVVLLLKTPQMTGWSQPIYSAFLLKSYIHRPDLVLSIRQLCCTWAQPVELLSVCVNTLALSPPHPLVRLCMCEPSLLLLRLSVIKLVYLHMHTPAQLCCFMCTSFQKPGLSNTLTSLWNQSGLVRFAPATKDCQNCACEDTKHPYLHTNAHLHTPNV